MMKKLFIGLIVVSLLAATIPVSSAKANGLQSSGVEPYKGLVGADSPFYGLKLFLQKIDVALEGNTSARLDKHLSLGRERLAEAYAAAIANNTGAADAALTEYLNNLKAINSTLDDEGIGDQPYINASDELQDQDDILANLTNDSTVSPALNDLFGQTLITADTIKNGRPFIWVASEDDDGTGVAYFIPPGQMKKLANGGSIKTPPGLSKKGYVSPEPVFVDGTVIWPWDDGYEAALKLATNATATANGNVTLASALGKHGHGKGIGNGNGNGKK